MQIIPAPSTALAALRLAPPVPSGCEGLRVLDKGVERSPIYQSS